MFMYLCAVVLLWVFVCPCFHKNKYVQGVCHVWPHQHTTPSVGWCFSPKFFFRPHHILCGVMLSTNFEKLSHHTTFSVVLGTNFEKISHHTMFFMESSTIYHTNVCFIPNRITKYSKRTNITILQGCLHWMVKFCACFYIFIPSPIPLYVFPC